ncbi:MAG TPA: ATP-dependent DNA ligase [Actinomycetota bacterium]
MTLPISPPLAPMLSKSRDELPRGEGWVYEPKWDGFRAIVFRDGEDVHIGSRTKRPLHRYFPELLGPLRKALPERCVVDGEIVLARDGRLDFEALQLRLHPAESRVRMLSEAIPASFVGFDLPALGDEDLCDRPLSERWDLLEGILEERSIRDLLRDGPIVARTPRTEDPEEAASWMEELGAFGLDGVIAKTGDLTYRPGERAMVKVKKRRTADCVVGGYRIHKDGEGVGSLLLALYAEDGTLHHVGFTASFRAKQRRELLDVVRPHHGESAFGEHAGPGGPSRWRQEETPWIPLRPELVCEVAFNHTTGRRIRHGATFVRWREDKDPRDCTMDQIA